MPVALFNLIETQHSKTKIQKQETFFLPVAQKRSFKVFKQNKIVQGTKTAGERNNLSCVGMGTGI